LQLSNLENYYHFLINSPPLKSTFHFEWDNKITYSNLNSINAGTPKQDNRGSLFPPINDVDDTSTLTDHSKTLLIHQLTGTPQMITNSPPLLQEEVFKVQDLQQQIFLLQKQLTDYNNQFAMSTK
jgi:hypothetical protein